MSSHRGRPFSKPSLVSGPPNARIASRHHRKNPRSINRRPRHKRITKIHAKGSDAGISFGRRRTLRLSAQCGRPWIEPQPPTLPAPPHSRASQQALGSRLLLRRSSSGSVPALSNWSQRRTALQIPRIVSPRRACSSRLARRQGRARRTRGRGEAPRRLNAADGQRIFHRRQLARVRLGGGSNGRPRARREPGVLHRSAAQRAAGHLRVVGTAR